MSRLRLLLLLTGLGALVSGTPVAALIPPGPDGAAPPVTAQSAQALGLLESAARAARTRTWSGTEHVVSTRAGEARLTVLEVHHTPGAGTTARVLLTDDHAVAADVLDENLLSLLTSRYQVRVAGTAVCAGRPARVVEVRRPGVAGPDGVAGRFWLDRATGLVLRREVLDENGAVVRSSAFVSLTVGPGAKASSVSYTPGEVVRATGRRLDAAALAALEAEGWPVIHTLPSGLQLFDARRHDGDGGDVLQLSYSDGLSTLSLFVQKGELPDQVTGSARPMAGGTVWVSPGATERVVWSGDGRTWTLVSDAPDSTVADAVLVLPHAPAAAAADGVLHRAWRGLSRVGAWLNPFD